MMVQQRAGHGFIAESFLRRTAIAPTNGHRKICSGMAGDSPGRTIAELFITARRRVRMERRGASARSWSGGTKKRRSGPGWTIPTTRKISHQTLRTIWTVAWESQDWAGRDLLRCIRTEWAGFMLQAA